jgi:peptidoglycan/xylan/chitin deacetylase (PgdA/CDA1 family)
MRFPGGLAKAMTLSYDDGNEQDVQLVETLDKYGLKCTFNLNTGLMPEVRPIWREGKLNRRLTPTAVKELYGNSEHEVALHSSTHVWLEAVPSAYAMKEVLDNKQALETLFERPVRGMAYPFGTYSDEVVNILKCCGVAYARTVKSTKKFDMPSDWLRWDPTCSHLHPELMTLAKNFVDTAPERTPKLFYLWGHGFEFERDNNWELIEKFGELVGHKDDIWYATNIEIYDYVKAYESLIWSTDLSIVHNPSATDVWVKVGMHGRSVKTIKIKSGETFKIYD